MSQSKALSMIGLATKAGKVASGEFMYRKGSEIRQEPYLVIVAGDASENTKKKFREYV